MSALRVTSMRLIYRLAYRVLHLAAILPRRPSRGVKCLLTHAGEVLLVRHTYGLRGVWMIPGGSVCRRETPLAAGAREMREELGLSGLELRELTTILMRLGRLRTNITCLHAELERPALHPDPVEIAQAMWFSTERLPDRLGSEVKSLIALLEHRAGT